MKTVAVTYDNGMIFQHFGHTTQFKIYNIENGQIASSKIVDTNGSGHGALAGFLKLNAVDTLICGGIGGGAKDALKQAGITLFGGVTGKADTAVEFLLKDDLDYNPDVKCDHHDKEHKDGNRSCNGNCANHNC